MIGPTSLECMTNRRHEFCVRWIRGIQTLGDRKHTFLQDYINNLVCVWIVHLMVIGIK